MFQRPENQGQGRPEFVRDVLEKMGFLLIHLDELYSRELGLGPCGLGFLRSLMQTAEQKTKVEEWSRE